MLFPFLFILGGGGQIVDAAFTLFSDGGGVVNYLARDLLAPKISRETTGATIIPHTVHPLR